MVKIYVVQKSYGVRGEIYEVSYNGQVIVASTSMPLLDGARALQNMGLSGPLEMWDHQRPYPRMRSTIEVAAKFTVREGDHRPKFKKWTPREYDAIS